MQIAEYLDSFNIKTGMNVPFSVIMKSLGNNGMSCASTSFLASCALARVTTERLPPLINSRTVPSCTETRSYPVSEAFEAVA